jgi:phage terminase large subunit-like protein
MLPVIAERLRDLSVEARRDFLHSLDIDEAEALAEDRGIWSLPYQMIPGGSWETWVMRCGRGAGKTFTGASITNEIASNPDNVDGGEIGIGGRTYGEARKTMIEGVSGLLKAGPVANRPEWYPGNQVLIWPRSGVRGYLVTADKPESARGKNFAWFWGDEPGFWPGLYDFWDMEITPAMRIGLARIMFTSTPKRRSDLRRIEETAGTVVTRASTFDNCYLDPRVLAKFKRKYPPGTRGYLQEMLAQYLPDNPDALWSIDDLDALRVSKVPDLEGVVVAVDPAVTAGENSDETGIVAVGKAGDHGFVLEDVSLKASPAKWAARAVALYYKHKADRIVAEVNNGGDLVTHAIHVVDPMVPVKVVRASRGKYVRAEPIAAMYERRRFHHAGHFPELEEQMVEFQPGDNAGSPDRMDALVWGATDLFLSGEADAASLAAYL